MVFREVLTVPGFHLRPRLCGIGPKGIGSRQAERHEGQCRHVERAIIGVPVGNIRLVTAEADGEIAFAVEVVLAVKHPVQHLCECGPYLSVAELLWQSLVPGHERQGLHGSHAVGNGAAKDGEGALGRDEPLKDDGLP